MRTLLAVVCLLILPLASSRAGAATFEIVGTGFATDISADGSVVVGNSLGSFEAFRWTPGFGVTPLGRCSCWAGHLAGTPDVSADGRVVTATISSADSSYVTAGRWTLGAGWEELLPPGPPDMAQIDNQYASAWGLSEDGSMVTGLYWRSGASDGTAHAFRASTPGSAEGLGSQGRDSRGNDANQDGSVVVGWSATSFGYWQPTVWVDGVMTVIDTTDGFAEATRVNPAGTITAGGVFDAATQNTHAALWTWNGSTWVLDKLGQLPGTFPTYGATLVNDLTPDGTMAVGYNAFDRASSAGFVWTPGTGMVNMTTYLAGFGLSVPAGVVITSATAVSHDGNTIVGIARDIFPPYYERWWIFREAPVLGVEETPVAAEPRLVFPNPLRSRGTIRFDVPVAGDLTLRVYDVQGRVVRTLLEGPQAPGPVGVAWDGLGDAGSPVPVGVYFVHARTGDHIETRRLLYLR